MQALRALTILITALIASSASAQPVITPTNTPPLPPFAAIFNDNLQLIDDAADFAQQVSTEGMERGIGDARSGVSSTRFVISPDASKVVYTVLSGQLNANGVAFSNFVLYDVASGQRTPLEASLTGISGLQLAISMDSQTLFYNDGLTYYRLPLTVGAQPTPLFSLPSEGGGGGGGSPWPTDPLFWTERNGSPSNTVPILAETPLGLLFTPPPPVSNDTGVYLYDFTQNQALIVDGQLMNAALSPDRAEIVGLLPPEGERPGHPDTQIVRVNIQTRAAETLPTSGPIDLVTWGAPGSNAIFYSTRIRRGDVDLDFVPQDVRSVLFGMSGIYADGTPVGVPRYDVEIYRYDLVSGEAIRLYQADAWAIGRMAAMPDGSTLVFSQISGLQRWVSDMSAGIDYPEPYSSAQTELYRLDLSGDIGAVELVGVNIQRPTFPAAS